MNNQAKPALAVVIALGGYLLITSAFYPIASLSVFDAKRVLQLVLFAALMLFAVAWAPLRGATLRQIARVPHWMGVLTALFFLIGLVSALRLDHPGYPLADVAMMFVLLVLITVVAASRELAGGAFDRWAIAMLAIFGFAVLVQELAGFAANWVLGSEFNYTEALVHFAHPRFYNQLQTWSIPLLAALPLVFPGRRWIRWAAVVLLGLQWFLVVSLAARGTFISLMIAMIFMALWRPAVLKSWLWYQLAGLLTGVVLYLGILQMNAALLPSTGPGEFHAHSVAGRPMMHTSGRNMLWRLSVEDALENPLLGAGPTRYACGSDLTLPAHPHSFPLRILGEWGFIALGILLVLGARIGAGLLWSLKDEWDPHSRGSPLGVMLATSLAAGFMHACLSGLLIMPASQVALALIAGWTLSRVGRTSALARISYFPTGVLITGLVITSVLMSFALTELPHLEDRTALAASHGPAVPRFWQDGRVCEYRYGSDHADQ